MLATRTELSKYNISTDAWFEDRTARDSYYVDNTALLMSGIYCAIGNDTDLWQLEQYNGANWEIVEPDSNYNLVITQAGLDAMTSITKGGYELYFAGIKILDTVISNPTTPLITWTDADLMIIGNVSFSIGTVGSPNQYDTESFGTLLSWKFNSSTGGLQYTLELPASGVGAYSDYGEQSWTVGTIGLYIKDPSNNYDDILFGIATLTSTVEKIATSLDIAGNTLRFYINTNLNNLGYVSNVEIIQETDCNIAEVPNETMLLYPYDATKQPKNCYLVDNLYGTGIPAIAVRKTIDSSTYTDSSDLSDWAFIQPSDNFINVSADQFASEVRSYMFVYWDSDEELYKLAEGDIDGDKVPIGLRIGNSIVSMGEITNLATTYLYNAILSSTGSGYSVGNELILVAENSLSFKIIVETINTYGGVGSFTFVGPTSGNIEVTGGSKIVAAVYDPRSPYPRAGSGCEIQITCTEQSAYRWNFPSSYFNTPLYCGTGDEKGMPVKTSTEVLVGWCTGTNSLKLEMDLQNEASYTTTGIARYATNTEVKEFTSNSFAAETTIVNPKTLGDNYLQTSLPINVNQPGNRLDFPINVESYVKFSNTIIGKGITAPYTNANNPTIEDGNVSFYGVAFQSMFADIGEYYESDVKYPAGTLITFGKGLKEISAATTECNGVISTNPGYILGEKKSDLYLPVALAGRVPVRFDNKCMPRFGDKVYLSKNVPGLASNVENGKCIGKIIARNFGTSKLIECIVRIDF